MSLSSYLSMRQMQAPIILYFEHLDSEYRSVRADITDREDLNTIDLLNEKRKSDDLSWNDLYTFELILTKYRPPERLRSKVMQLRNDYRNVAGQQEYDEYMASKPPNLMEPPDPTDPPDATKAEYEKLLREDIKDLLGRLFLLYEILPVREAKLKGLTWWAAGLCLGALVLLFVIVLVLFMSDPARRAQSGLKIPSLTIFVVAIVGSMGGFVSAIQRIQKPPSGGDSFYNLARMFYASYSVFVAPITGAVFAILLYLMFTSGILRGSFFPTIYTPSATYQAARGVQPPTGDSGTPAQPQPSPTQAAQTAPGPQPSPTATRPQQTAPRTQAGNQSQAGTPVASPTVAPTPAPTVSPTPGPTPTASPTVTPTPAPTPISVPTSSLSIKDFLAQSGPAGGADYAMLILWCFIAGFAERFVPDALDRLISQKGGAGGKSD